MTLTPMSVVQNSPLNSRPHMQWSKASQLGFPYGPNLGVFLISYSTSNLLSLSLLPSWLEPHHLSQLVSQLHAYYFHFIYLFILHLPVQCSSHKTSHIVSLHCEHLPISFSSPLKPHSLRQTDISWVSYVKLQHISFTSSSPSWLNFCFGFQKNVH